MTGRAKARTALLAAALAAWGGCRTEPVPGARARPTVDTRATPKPESPKPEASTPAEAPRPPDAVERFRAALRATASCAATPGSARPADAACTRAMKAALRAARFPPSDVTPAARREQLQRVASVLGEALDDPSPVVVFNALRANAALFATDPPTRAALERRMVDADPGIATWAAAARLHDPTMSGEADRALALAALVAHRHEPIRLRACEYLGHTHHRGRRPLFDAMLARARATGEPLAIRICAIRQLGTLGGDTDVSTIAGFLEDLALQEAAVYALANGLRTPVAMQAYVTYFHEHRADPAAISPAALAAFLPWEEDRKNLPRELAIAALQGMLTTPDMPWFARTESSRILRKLKARAALEAVVKALERATDDPSAVNLLVAVRDDLSRTP